MILKISFREEKSALLIGRVKSYRVKDDILIVENKDGICNITPLEVIKYISVEYEESVKWRNDIKDTLRSQQRY